MTAKKKRLILGKNLKKLNLRDYSDHRESTPPPMSFMSQGDERFQDIAINKLKKGKFQPRVHINQANLEELADSIKAQGIIQPIVVRNQKSGYEILAGERRWKAAKLAGLKTVPVMVREADDKTALAVALIENIQREDLNALEEARALQRLIEEFSLTHKQTAEYVGKNRVTVTNALRLLTLHKDAQNLLEKGLIEMGHARALLSLDSEMQSNLAKIIVTRSYTVRQTELWVRNYGLKKDNKKKLFIQPTEEITSLETRLVETYGKRSKIHQTFPGKGKVIISYKTKGDLEKIIDKLCNNDPT